MSEYRWVGGAWPWVAYYRNPFRVSRQTYANAPVAELVGAFPLSGANRIVGEGFLSAGST